MIDRFKEITDEMVELYERKNSDYGDSVHDTYVKYGPVSFLVRMEDKINRVRQLTNVKYETRVTDEKIRDTLIDLANYAILMVLETERASMDGCIKINHDGISFEEFIKSSATMTSLGVDYGKDASESTMWEFETKKDD